MELVQTVLAQIAADSADDLSAPGGLISDLDRHRDELAGRPGFRGARITRSINPNGNVLLSVETRWRDAASMNAYASSSPNAASIVRAHDAELTPGSVQVMSGESVGDSASAPAATMSERSSFALFVPLGVLLFGLLIIYGLSRIYLALPSKGATTLAALVAIGILGVCGYIASNAVIPRWAVASIIGGVVVLLAGGATFASIHGKNEVESLVVESPTAEAGNGGGGENAITFGDNFFDYQGQKDPKVPAAAGQQVTFNIHNGGNATHNMHVAAGGSFSQVVCRAGGAEPCSTPASIAGGKDGTIAFNLPAGTYDFRCDFHPAEMKGTIEVK